MGGSESIRGFKYQAISAVLQLLNEDDKTWDTIQVEYKSTNEKVDIALLAGASPVSCIQVKSSVNLISEANIRRWADDLKADVQCPKYELILIGQLSANANKLIKNARSELGVSINNMIFDTGMLRASVRDGLHRYICMRGRILEYDKIDFIASDLQNNIMWMSTDSKPLTRGEFDRSLDARIRLLEKEYDEKRIKLIISSFPIQNEELDPNDPNVCILSDMFDGRLLKPEYDWNRDYFGRISAFLRKRHKSDIPYTLVLQTHLSGCFAAGRQCHTRYGINIFPKQSGVLWDDSASDDLFPDWITSEPEILDKTKDEFAVVISASVDAYPSVKTYIEKSGLPVGRILNFKLNDYNVKNGTHAIQLAKSAYNTLSKYYDFYSVLHFFAAAPTGLMFYLGREFLKSGKCTLYEYDYAKTLSTLYYPSITVEGED